MGETPILLKLDISITMMYNTSMDHFATVNQIITKSLKDYFTCIVCDKKFKDGWDHTLKNKDGFMLMKDKPHADYARKVAVSNYRDSCFCGNKIAIRAYSEDGWCVECDFCGFLWDED